LHSLLPKIYLYFKFNLKLSQAKNSAAVDLTKDQSTD